MRSTKEPVTATVTLDKSEFKDVTISYTDADGNAKERSGHQVSVGYVAKQLKDAGIIKYKASSSFTAVFRTRKRRSTPARMS